jgi:Flp pilus assembly protein TadG
MTAAARHFTRNEHGGPSAEFALVAPVAVALILGAINMGFLMYAGATLNFAAQDAARCQAIGLTCTDATTTQTYAAGRYKGPVTSPVFTAAVTATCSQVSATANYSFNLGIASATLPLSTTACYPVQPTA